MLGCPPALTMTRCLWAAFAHGLFPKTPKGFVQPAPHRAFVARGYRGCSTLCDPNNSQWERKQTSTLKHHESHARGNQNDRGDRSLSRPPCRPRARLWAEPAASQHCWHQRGLQPGHSLPQRLHTPMLPHNSTHGPQPLYFLSTPLFPQHSSNPTILFSPTQGPQLLRRPRKPHTRPLEPHTRLPNSTQRSPNPPQRPKPHRSASPRLPHQYLRMAVTCSGLGCSG